MQIDLNDVMKYMPLICRTYLLSCILPLWISFFTTDPFNMSYLYQFINATTYHKIFIVSVICANIIRYIFMYRIMILLLSYIQTIIRSEN